MPSRKTFTITIHHMVQKSEVAEGCSQSQSLAFKDLTHLHRGIELAAIQADSQTDKLLRKS
jgi:hypothetical protein